MLTLLNSPYFYIAVGLVILSALFWIGYLWLFFLDLKKAKLLSAGPSSDYATIDGVKIHYQILGAGRPLVFLHGIGASVFTWRFVLPLLAMNFQVVLVDLPGFGRSSKDHKRTYDLDEQALILKKFIETLGLQNVGLVGSSMGGAIALWMCKLFPDTFTDVAVLAPAVSSQLMPLELAKLSHLVLPQASLLINKTLIRSIIKNIVTRPELVTDEMIRNYQRPFIEEPNAIRTFILATNILRDTRLPKELNTLKANILIIYGAKDKLVPRAVIQQLQNVLPHATYVEHEFAGHHPMEDEPQWLSEKLSEFF